jgi:hypothetical protein
MGFFETDVENIVDAIKKGIWHPHGSSTPFEVLESLQTYLLDKFKGEVFEFKEKDTPGLMVHFKEGAKVNILYQVEIGSYDDYYKLVGEIYDLMVKRKSEVLVILNSSSTNVAFKQLLEDAIKFFDDLRDHGVGGRKIKLHIV